ncbi:MAG TPA: polysaccharide biosynthesis/export family protein [Pyrinomonadaceae bacterium]|jgi:polysaccharide export outer membrane protein
MRKIKEPAIGLLKACAFQGLRASVVLVILLCAMSQSARAQQTADKPSADGQVGIGTNVPSPLSQRDDRYRIGPNDVLDIRVFNKPILSRDNVRVDGRGIIRMPLIETDIQAACRTETELAQEIARLYLKYQRRPQVDVFVKEYQSQPVAVIGAVNAPGRFQLQRRVRLLELLAFANGPAERAGRSVQIIHSLTPTITCELTAKDDSDEIAVAGFISYNLSETLRGEEKANPFVRPGDIITVPDADQIYVVGNVMKPSAIPLKETITVSRAIAMAGGKMPDTKSDRVRIIRQLSGSTTKTEIFVDLNAIDKRKAEDIVLQPNDIVDVPTASGKRLLKSFVGAIVPSVAQLPVRIVP